jgi:hypothetical protein
MRAQRGDWLVIEGPHTGDIRREGQILEVRDPDGAPPYLVRWRDGAQSLVFPGPGGHVQHRPPHPAGER